MPSDDIVTRLRNFHDQRDSWQTLTEAADEIERLRAELERLTTVARFVDEVYILTKEGEELWDKMRAWRDE